MKQHIIAAALAAAALVCSAQLPAQPKNVSPDVVEATVTVTQVDPKLRAVTFRGPRGVMQTVTLPPELNAQNVKVGDRFRLRYMEPVALSIVKGAIDPGAAAAGGTAPALQVEMLDRDAPKPKAVLATVQRATGIVEAVDVQNRRLAVRTPKGDTLALKAGEGIDLTKLSPGDPVSLEYTDHVAVEMIPQPPPAPVG